MEENAEFIIVSARISKRVKARLEEIARRRGWLFKRSGKVNLSRVLREVIYSGVKEIET